jgi:uncharacterized membrane protein
MADESQPAAQPPASPETAPNPAATAPAKPVREPAVSPPKPAQGRRIYQASAARKTVLSLVFLLLLPFFASLPAMFYQRLSHQLWDNTLGFVIFAGAFAIIMLLVVLELIHSIRSRVEVGDTALRFTLPATRRAGIPKLRYRRGEIPYAEIDAVEMRREIYGSAWAPVLLRGARIVTKSGEKIPLGYVSEANVDPALPIPEIASEVARRAGLEVTDRGNVRREVRKKLRGIQAAETDGGITDAEVAALNRRHNNFVLALCAALFLLVAGGLMMDILSMSIDQGERAHQIVQQAVKPSPQAQKK